MPIDEKIFEQIYAILKEHKGAKNAIDSITIAKMIGVDPGASSGKIRKYIRMTIDRYKIPIGATTNGGYFLMENERELMAYFISLQKRSRKIEDKAFKMVEIYREYYGEDSDIDITREVIDPTELEDYEDTDEDEE